MKHYILSAVLAFASVTVTQATEQNTASDEDTMSEQEFDTAAGEELYQSVCRNCHGPKAQGVASYPRLADKDMEYITGRLERYRDGERIGPNSMLMIPHARDLSDDDITNLAGYITTSFE